MSNYKKRGLAVFTSGISALTISATPLIAAANPSQAQTRAPSIYTTHLEELNNSGVSGRVHLKYKAGSQTEPDTLRVNLRANGTTPDETHPVHIHGNEHPEVAMCPTTEQDANEDGFVSVIEGAATYGPIKLNLTSPQTAFGAGPTPALFTAFAGTPDPSTFPKANQRGSIRLNETYSFGDSAAARGALQSITPLENQHIVVHGGMAPASVDADAFAALGAPITTSPEEVVYDVLLPIACGEIMKTSHKDKRN